MRYWIPKQYEEIASELSDDKPNLEDFIEAEIGNSRETVVWGRLKETQELRVFSDEFTIGKVRLWVPFRESPEMLVVEIKKTDSYSGRRIITPYMEKKFRKTFMPKKNESISPLLNELDPIGLLRDFIFRSYSIYYSQAVNRGSSRDNRLLVYATIFD
ncbi:MAG: hypothetical protein AABX51_00380 [Nanoarchaeota archaeon]